MKNLNTDPLIYADIGFIRETISNLVAQNNFSAGVAAGLQQLIELVVATLEAHALITRITGKGFIFDGQLSVAAAVQRAHDLRELLRF